MLFDLGQALVRRAVGLATADRLSLVASGVGGSFEIAGRPRPRRRRAWLASTAFTGAFIAVIAGHPDSALAACTGINSGSVTCDTAGGALVTTFNGPTVVNVNAGAQITGGATATVTGAGSLTLNNNDTIFGIKNNALNGVDLTNNVGAITYVGNGNVTATNIAVAGINASAGAAGDVSITNNAAVSGTFAGIGVQHTGTGAVLVTGTGTATAGTYGIIVQHSGLGPAAGTNGIAITGSGAVSSFGTAILANISNAANASNILIDRAGTVSGVDGILATTAGLGNVTVTGSSTVTATTGNAIQAVASGGGDVTVTGVGNVSSASLAGIAVGALNGNGNVVIAPAGTVSGQTYGIGAAASGSGNVTITTTQDVTGHQNGGIVADVVDGRITVNVVGGTVTGSAAGFLPPGIQAIATGTGGATITVNAGASVTGDQFNGVVVTGTTNIITNSGTIRGAGGIVASGSTTITNAGAIIGTLGPAVIFNGAGNTLIMEGAGATLSGQAIGGGADTFRFAGTGTNSFDVSQIDTGWALLDKTGTSNWILTGTAIYAGPVTVNGGTLSVNGDLTSASSLTVNAGGTLGGNGIVGATTINGGTLAPGNSIGTLTIGSLTMTAASTYLVQVSGTSSDKTIVTGAAIIAGKVVVDPLARVAATTTYTILTSAGTAGTFSAAEFLAANSFARNARLSYVGNDVLLTLDPGLLAPSLPGNANINQKNVAAAIDNALVGGGNMPAGFNALFALSGDALLNGLTQASGETATGSQQATFDAMNLFMGVLTDPFTAGRGGNAPGATGFAEEGDATNAYAATGRKRSGAEREAYAMVTKAPPRSFEARWNVWAAGFGGSQTTDGNATLGSNTATSRVGGVAVGADYWFSPNTLAGFALAGGGTNFSVNGAGSGRSDLFQAGAFVRHTVGSAYVTAAAAYGWQDITTDRTVTIAGIDQLRAHFNANAYSGRVEGGNRYVTPWMGGIGLTPYAAAQVTAFDLPAYAESVVSGTNTFALAYTAKTATATRSELGLRSDKSYAVGDALLTLRGRAAWAHDFNTDRNIAATFQTLPGASFVVNGAAQSHDVALATASAEMKFISGISLAATFEGEFSDVTRSYAGKGVARYTW